MATVRAVLVPSASPGHPAAAQRPLAPAGASGACAGARLPRRTLSRGLVSERIPWACVAAGTRGPRLYPCTPSRRRCARRPGGERDCVCAGGLATPTLPAPRPVPATCPRPRGSASALYQKMRSRRLLPSPSPEDEACSQSVGSQRSSVPNPRSLRRALKDRAGVDGDIVPRFHAQPPPSFRRTPLGGLKSLSSQCRHRTRRLTPRHGHVDWSESDSSWRALSRDSSAAGF